jgi:hypothetical protein
MGGWIFGRWPAPTSASADSTPVTTKKSEVPKADKPGSISAVPAKKPDIPKTAPKPVPKTEKAGGMSSASDKSGANCSSTPKLPQLRSPGINQSGPLLGFFPEVKSPPKVPVVKSLDQEALRDLLNGT